MVTAEAQSTLAGIITAFATVIIATGGLIAALTLFLPVYRQTKKTGDDVSKIHTIVNQQRTDAQRYNIALTEALRRAGVEIPIDQSLPVVGEPDAQPGQPK